MHSFMLKRGGLSHDLLYTNKRYRGTNITIIFVKILINLECLIFISSLTSADLLIHVYIYLIGIYKYFYA